MDTATRIRLLREMNPDYAKAIDRCEPWAMQHVDEVAALNGEGSRKYVHRRRKEDGKPHRWCSGCPFPEGCVCCDLT